MTNHPAEAMTPEEIARRIAGRCDTEYYGHTPKAECCCNPCSMTREIVLAIREAEERGRTSAEDRLKEAVAEVTQLHKTIGEMAGMLQDAFASMDRCGLLSHADSIRAYLNGNPTAKAAIDAAKGPNHA